MEKFYGDEKPSLEDLAHFGVKGMKWGERHDRKFQAKVERVRTSGSPRQQRNMQIKVARKNIETRQREIHAIVRASNKTKDPAQRHKLDALAAKKAKELFEHPDQLTASRMTTGEKWVNGLLVGGALAGAAAVGASGGGRPSARGPIRVQAHQGTPFR